MTSRWLKQIRWSRFPLIRDWLAGCETCTGPVLIMDVRDSYFQLDPFGPGSPVVEGLQVFEEPPHQVGIACCYLREIPSNLPCAWHADDKPLAYRMAHQRVQVHLLCQTYALLRYNRRYTRGHAQVPRSNVQ